MQIRIFENAAALGRQAGVEAAELIRQTIESKGTANIILATGTSQLATINQLISEPIDWSKVVMFHLDEYIGLPVTHPASFRKYLQENFLSKVPALQAVYLVNGEADPDEECKRLSELIKEHPIDLAFVGIGENGHLAFNDPPADFITEVPYITVTLDEACRKQQLGEGWFASMDEIPTRAISMSVSQIMKSKHLVCSVPDSRKALAVKNTVEEEVSDLFPASMLQFHAACQLYLDVDAASLLSNKTKTV